MRINDTVFQHFLICKRKASLALSGEVGEPHEYAIILQDIAREYRRLAAASLLKKFHVEPSAVEGASIDDGFPLLLGYRIVSEPFEFYFDALRSVKGRSKLGDFHYEPILFVKEKPSAEDRKLLLALGGHILGEVQGVRPTRGAVVHGEDFSLTNIRLEPWSEKSQDAIAELLKIHDREAQPPLALIKHCDVCQFRDRCRREAVEKDDLTLLRGIKPAEVAAFEGKGIFTVNQLSYTFRARRRPRHLRDRPTPYSHALKALAIREHKVHVFKRPTIPAANTYVFVDTEGDSNAHGIYLIGALVVANGMTAFHSFWADGPAQEEELFDKLLALLASLDQPHVFHFGSYEASGFKRMAVGSRKKPFQSLLTSQSTNILKLIYGNVYFPTYSNSLKDIGHFLGCQWSDPDASGVQSLVWRRHWERTRDSGLKDKLLQYNREDCEALRKLTEHLVAMVQPNGPRPDSFTTVESLSEQEDYGRWGQRNFAVAEFESMADHAYFDYQRSKVYLRSQPELKRIHRPKRTERRSSPKPNRVVTCMARKCWRCKSKSLVQGTRWHTKRQFDLRISATGIRRFITEFRAPFYRCDRCKQPVFTRSYKRQPYFGHSIMAWCIYQHVVNRLSFENVALTLRECFGLTFPLPRVFKFKRAMARYYKVTYNRILKRLIGGKLIHADETKAKLKKETGYVWVLTNMLDVAYMYKPTREGEFLHDLLEHFNGVLVSDFYSAYDSLPCAQQKCLIHLMWDINADLLKNPFDEDIKGIATEFGELLRGIIATVDRRGLKARWLRRHKKDVTAFYRKIETAEIRSTVAQHYRDRLAKYREKLFTFLDHDGIPWNNNNAEHAIKPFAKHRVLAKRTMLLSGLEDYLVLLSIRETCEYRGVSFLKFLLSGERDIEKFCEKVW